MTNIFICENCFHLLQMCPAVPKLYIYDGYIFDKDQKHLYAMLDVHLYQYIYICVCLCVFSGSSPCVLPVLQEQHQVFQPPVVFFVLLFLPVVVLFVVGAGSGVVPAGVGAAGGRGQQPGGLDLRPQRATLLHL